MKTKQEQETEQWRQWRLREYLIGGKGDSDRLHWGMWAYVHSEDILDWFTGHAWIVGEVLLLSSWKCCGGAEEKNLDEVEKVLNSLPNWDRTPYYLKMADIGNSGIRDCKTDELVSDEIQNRLMPQLGFHKATEVELAAESLS
jgi:hypothetical protein